MNLTHFSLFVSKIQFTYSFNMCVQYDCTQNTQTLLGLWSHKTFKWRWHIAHTEKEKDSKQAKWDKKYRQIRDGTDRERKREGECDWRVKENDDYNDDKSKLITLTVCVYACACVPICVVDFLKTKLCKRKLHEKQRRALLTAKRIGKNVRECKHQTCFVCVWCRKNPFFRPKLFKH